MKHNLHLKALFAFILILLFIDVSAANRKDINSQNVSIQEERIIKGKVTSNQGEMLPGVNVVIKGTTNGTITNVNGEYSIKVPAKQALLVFSFIGYESQEKVITDQSVVDVVLKPSTEKISDVVVIGYGAVKKSDLTGSVSSVKAEDLKAVPATTFDQALQGRAAGVQVVQSSGVPGGATNIRIRGTSSVNASSEPLYVIDGMLVNSDAGEVSVGGRGPNIGPLASINPDDIESIEVLKDASAAAIYGSRGANGVILITTKRGKEGKGKIDIDCYYGVQQVAHKLNLLNAAQFANLVNDAAINAGQVPVYVNPKNLGKGTDWQEALFRIAPIANYQVSFSGGTKKTKYAVSGAYFTQDGIVVGSSFDRYSFRVNLDQEINPYVKLGTNISFSGIGANRVETGPGAIVDGVVSNALQMNPILPVYDATQPGGYTYESDRKDAIGNPVAEAKEYKSLTTTYRLIGNTYLKFQLSKGLELKTSFGIDGLTSKSRSFGPNYLKRTANSKGEAWINDLQALTWLNENTLTFNHQFNQNNRIDALFGFTMQQFKNESLSASAFDFPDNRTGYHNLSAALNPQNPVNNESKWSMLSYLGRVNYNLKEKYLLTFSGRIDGSSKFAEGNKYGFFPSGAFAWRASQEEFLKNIEWLSNLKVRTSYGFIGNQSISPYQSLALIGPVGQGVFNSASGSEVFTGNEPLSYPNKNLKWETTEQANIGIDFGALDNKITLSADVYLKKTSDLLLNTPIPYTTGFMSTLLNVGNVQNKGIDLDFRTINFQGQFSWNTSINFSINRNKITNLAGQNDINLGYGNLLREGQPIGTFYGYVFDGIFQSDEEAANSPVLKGQEPTGSNPLSRAKAGDRKYKDLNGDGVIDESDRTIIGSAQPDFIYGINNELSYKNFRLTIFFQGSKGNDLINMNLSNLENFNGQQNVLAEAGLNRWTPENHSNKYPRALASGSLDNVFSSRFVEDASYLRLKNVTLSYTLPNHILSRFGVANLRLYATGTNLWTVTGYRGYDPEGNAYGNTTNIVGVDNGNYPQTKSYTFGVQVGF